MKILITGANGFIGKNLRESLEKKYDIFAPERTMLDLTNQENVERYLAMHSFDVILHCANTNNVVRNVTTFDVLNNNLQMFYNIESCHDLYGKMYYFGSGAEYDMRYYIPQMEESYFGKHIPQDSYGFSKYTMSRITEQNSNIYDLRLFGVYGKYEEWRRRFISNNLCRCIKNMNMTINKNMKFDYLYINDLCRIIEWFIENQPKYKHYNICTGSVVDLYTIAKKINQVTGLNKKIEVFETGWKKEYSGNNNRLKQEIGEFCFTPMEDAINELYQYYTLIEKYIFLE